MHSEIGMYGPEILVGETGGEASAVCVESAAEAVDVD